MKSEVTLSHAKGDAKITIEHPDAAVCSYLANRIREVFKSKSAGDRLVEQLEAARKSNMGDIFGGIFK